MKPVLKDPLKTVVAHSPKRSKTYLGSPGILSLSDGSLIISHDFFGSKSPKNTNGDSNLTHIYISKDYGTKWSFLSEIRGAFWSKLFSLNEKIYLLGCSSEYGNIVIRESTDQGGTWSQPTNEKSGLLFKAGQGKIAPNYHGAPVPVLITEKYIYRAFEDNTSRKWPQGFKACVISAKKGADLLDSSSWTMSNKLAFSPPPNQSNFKKKRGGWLEGNVVSTPNGQVYNILRVNSLSRPNLAAITSLSKDRTHLTFDPSAQYISFPGGMSKFTVRYDELSKKYLTLSNEVIDKSNPFQRNHLVLASSDDLINWKTEFVILSKPEKPCLKRRLAKIFIPRLIYPFLVNKIGFQYADWIIDGDNLLIALRTAFNGARNFHDSNYITFYRIRNLQSFLKV